MHNHDLEWSCPQALMGKCFILLLPCSKEQPCCPLHTCDNSRFFALLTSNSLILDGLKKQEPGDSHSTHARKFFARSDHTKVLPANPQLLYLSCLCLSSTHIQVGDTGRRKTQASAVFLLMLPCKVHPLSTISLTLQTPATKHGARAKLEQ